MLSMLFNYKFCLTILGIILVMLPQSFNAQNNCMLKITGKIIDLDDSKELEGTFVTIKNTSNTKITNEHGNFIFSNLCEGKYELIIQHIGCRDSIVVIDLKKDFKITIKLPHSAIELNEIDIMDKQADTKKTQTVNEIKGKELLGTHGQSLGESLKLVNGVTSLNTGSTISKPMIHGLQGYRILILNNGIRQEGQQWGNEHAPEIDPFIAQKLTVIKGANSVRYGSDAMAGVILVEPNDLPDTAAITGEVNLVGMSNGKTGVASGILQGYFDKVKYFSWRIQGTYKKGGTIKTPTYYLKNTGVEELNYSYTLGYHRKKFGAEFYYSQFNTKIGIFSGAHIGKSSI
jgi:iron complex outermembrane recepter protein